MENQKKVYVSFKYRECDSFAEYLHEMSLGGWHFTSWRTGLVFEKGEPEDIAYAVEVFPKGTEMDLKPGEDAEEYADYCEAAGWKLIDGKKRFCIFRKIREDAIDIVTPEERFCNIRKAEWRQWCSDSLSSILIALLYIWQFFSLNFENAIFMNALVLCHGLLAVNAIWKSLNGFYLFLWAYRIKKELRSGKRPQYKSNHKKRSRIPIAYVFTIAATGLLCWFTYQQRQFVYIFVLLGVVGILILMAFLLEVFRPSRDSNHLIQTAVGIGIWMAVLIVQAAVIFGDEENYVEISAEEISREDVPLIMEDYKEVAEPMIYIDEGSVNGFFGRRLHCYIKYGQLGENAYDSQERVVSDFLLYDVYYCEYDWILDRIWEEETDRVVKNSLECTDEWGAELAIHTGGLNYYVRYSNAILCLYECEELDEAQISVIRNKLELL